MSTMGIPAPAPDSVDDLLMKSNEQQPFGDMELNEDDGLDDHFDPDELLTSPLFNDFEEKLSASFTHEAENSFGNFGVDPDDTLYAENTSNDAPITISDTCSSEEFDSRFRSSSTDHSLNSLEYDTTTISNTHNELAPVPQALHMSPQQHANTNTLLGMVPEAAAAPAHPSFQVTSPHSQMMAANQGAMSPLFQQEVVQQHPMGLPNNVFTCMQQPHDQPSFDDDSIHCEPNPIANNMVISVPLSMPPGRNSSSGNSSFNSESLHHSPGRVPRPEGFLGSPSRRPLGSPVRRPLVPAASMGLHLSVGQATRSMMVGQTPPPRSQSYNGGGMASQQSSPNKLQLMQMHLQKMQELQMLEQMQQRPNNNILNNNNHMNNNNNAMGGAMGLSQSMHGATGRVGCFNNNNNNGMVNNMSMSSSYDQLSHSSHAPSSPSFMGGNVSIASDVQNMKGSLMMNNGYCDPSSRQQQQQQQQQSNNPTTVNDVMEKLCESMKRSAMSRSMIKQFSGRSVTKQGPSRQPLSRSNSGHSAVERTLSNRGIMKQGSMRMMDDSSGRSSVPIRRQASITKHQLQHPTRGVYRHDSQRSLGGQSNHSISLHVDGRNVGTL